MAHRSALAEQGIILGIFVGIVVFTGVMSWFTPALTRRDLFFGVSVAPNARETAPARRILWTYRLAVVVLTLAGAIGLGLLIGTGGTGWLATPWPSLALLAAILFLSLPYFYAHVAVRRLVRAEPGLGAISPAAAAERAPVAALVPRRYGDLVPWFWEALPLAIIAATACYLIVTYPLAPAIIPTHFGPNGPDRYAPKAVGSYFLLIWTQLFLEILLTGLAVATARGKAQPDLADLRFRRRGLRFLYLVKVTVLALLGVTAVAVARAGLGGGQVAGWESLVTVAVPVVVVVVIFIGAIALALTTGQGGSRLAGAAPVDRMDDRYWLAGIIYYNPDDPSIIVERRFGFGWTLNFGNRWGQLFLLLLLAIIVASALLPMLLR